VHANKALTRALGLRDGVGERRAADDLMPLFDRNLAGDDGGGALMAVFDDFEEVALFRLGENREAPVVQDQELDPREAFEQAAIAAVAAGESQRREAGRRSPWLPLGPPHIVAA